jgi:hypothetical protein
MFIGELGMAAGAILELQLAQKNSTFSVSPHQTTRAFRCLRDSMWVIGL